LAAGPRGPLALRAKGGAAVQSRPTRARPRIGTLAPDGWERFYKAISNSKIDIFIETFTIFLARRGRTMDEVRLTAKVKKAG
jgi:ABC-type amino acid transport substrate-binding protein